MQNVSLRSIITPKDLFHVSNFAHKFVFTLVAIEMMVIIKNVFEIQEFKFARGHAEFATRRT